jgi:hypothetical protein
VTRAPKDTAYATICVSTYHDDLAALDATVAEFKRKGFTRASRSSVIRAALRGFVTREYTRDAEGPL